MIVVCMPPPVIPWQKRATSKWKYVLPKKINIQNADEGRVNQSIARLHPIQLVNIPNIKVPETKILLHKALANNAQHIQYQYNLVCRRMRWWSYDDFDVGKIAHKMQWKHSLFNENSNIFFYPIHPNCSSDNGPVFNGVSSDKRTFNDGLNHAFIHPLNMERERENRCTIT